MKKIQYNGSSKILNGIVTKVNLIIDKLVVDVKVNGTSVVVVNEDGEREADIDLSLADQNVKQSPTTSSDNSDYRVLLSKSANDTEETDISRKDTNLKYNPSTGNLQTTKLNGNTVPSGSGNDTLAKTSDIPDLSNYVQKSLTVGLIKNDGTIDQTQYATMSDIPDELADLADDVNHRLVTDTDKTTWNDERLPYGILNTEDLNDLKTSAIYVGRSGNTCLNKPTDVAQFSLLVLRTAYSSTQYCEQILITPRGYEWRRNCYQNTWSAWELVVQVSDSDKTAWDAKADISDITSAINDLDVASTSIGAGETLATIKEENGKIAVTKQAISITNKQIANYCLVGTSSAISGSNTWHKVASVILDVANEDAIIMLAVHDTFPPDTDVEPNGGILYCRARQNALGTINYAKLKFVGNSGFYAKNFRLYYTIVSDTSITVEIWTSLSRRYAFRKFVVLSMGNRWQSNLEKWTLYNSTSASAAPTESSTCVRVECEDNTYKQTDNNILGSKNLIPYPPYYNPSTYSKNNVDITVDEYGVITATGSKPSANFAYTLRYKTKNQVITLDPTQSYIMSGMVGGSSSTVRFLLDLWTENQNPATDSATRLYQSDGETTIPTGYKYLQITLYFYGSANNLFPLTVKPMLRLATIVDDTFEPYADTNRNLSIRKCNLTEIAPIENSNTASQAYAIGDYMCWYGGFYRVTQAISSGGAITLNTNVYSTSIGNQLRWKASSVSANEIQVKTTNTNIASGNASEIVIEEIRLYADSGVINNWFSCYRHIPLYNAVGYYKDCDFSWWDGNDYYYASISITKSGNYIIATCEAAKKGSSDITTYSDFKMYITVSEKS